jgi:MoaA/NifB/PqqE/SkfB family radical SAM enzyme
MSLPPKTSKSPALHGGWSPADIVSGIYNRVSFAGSILKTNLLKQRIPLVVFLVVNNRCNLKCAYCFGDYPMRDVPDIPTSRLLELVDELADMGTKRMVVHGGETLMRKDIGQIVRHIKSRRIHLAMVTNGYFLRQRYQEILEVDSLCISLDGTREGNDINRGEGSFEKILDAIQFAKEVGFHLRVNATLTRYTMNDVEYLARLAQEIGFELEYALLYKPLSDKNKHYQMSDEEMRSTLEKILELKHKRYPIFISESAIKHALQWPTTYRKIQFYASEMPPGLRFRCHWGHEVVVIDADGFVYPCFPLNDTFPALNVLEVGFKKAYQHLESNSCQTCYHLTNSDNSYLFEGKPDVWLDQAKVNLRDLLRK